MKKAITCSLALLAGAYAVHAQGTVSFANYGTSTYIYVSYKALNGTTTPLGGANTGPTPTASNYGTAGVIGNGNDWTVALYGAVGANLSSLALGPLSTVSLAPVVQNFANGISDMTPGTWSSGLAASLPGSANGSTATVQIVAWYSGTGDTLSQAETAGLPWGESATANVVLGAPPGTPPGLPATALGNFTVTASVPEPSTVALGVLGASTFLMRLRRKQ